MQPLVTVDDLSAVGLDLEPGPKLDRWIAAASSAVREAADATITTHTATVRIGGTTDERLYLPGWAVQTVEDVKIDGDTVTGWRLLDGYLWRSCGWQAHPRVPSVVEVTYTQGVDECPADLLPLVASLVAAQAAAEAEGFDPKRGLAYERIDDYQYGTRTGDDEVLSPTDLPERTRQMLRNRFGRGATVIGSY